jgi:hypothetical protein
MRAHLYLTLACLAAGGPAIAAPSLTINRAAAVITVTPEDRADFAVTITPGAAKAPLPVLRSQGGATVIDGGVRSSWSNRCRGGENPDSLRLRYGAGPELRIKDLARIDIRAPRQLALDIANDGRTQIGPNVGGVVRVSGCGWSTIGPAQGDLRADLDGSGDVRLATVSGALTARLNGSGDIVAASAARADLDLNGSGDVFVGPVAGAVRAQLDGSGDIDVKTANGPAELALNGSGDIRLGGVRGQLKARLDGSGDIAVARVDGPVVLRLDGSGGIDVADGNAPQLNISASGSGTVRFGGAAGDVNVSAGGSSDVIVARANGAIVQSKFGSADISIGR